MTITDRHRSRVYTAETILSRMLENCAASGNPTVTIDSITLTLPPEARFATIADVQRYVDRLMSSDQVIDRLGQRPPVTVRARNSTADKAHYEPDTAVIAMPISGSARAMLRELVVVHEVAHHFDTSDGATHGPKFLDIYLTLLDLVMGPQMALALRILLAHNDVSMTTRC
ncbi:TIGR04338 family metallohydrolase [Mycolicibacterium sphagni]|uniref:TIGR04338 family metallohydrolase n=1 Tax=Mycolicibacterium sphagni TaxID=1786 RepID=A0ABX2JZM2_9MYCO|nr:TIGR04338 family metallohydrolase [Mycolicibacterium sphagni]NTY62197.1 TIGR04338 family metallohydrolase [Mycolicibacterium sphagni]